MEHHANESDRVAQFKTDCLGTAGSTTLQVTHSKGNSSPPNDKKASPNVSTGDEASSNEETSSTLSVPHLNHDEEVKEETLSTRIDPEFVPSKLRDDHRSSVGHSDGGFALTDKEVINKFRGAFKSLIGEIGTKIMKGDFNLTTVSLPIKAMDHHSIL